MLNITTQEELDALECASKLENAVKALSLPWNAGDITSTIFNTKMSRDEMLATASKIRSLLNEATSHLDELEKML